MFSQTFKVSGRFTFPVDMLRYDNCFPYMEKDSAEITKAMMVNVSSWEVTLQRFISYKDQPTIERWKSFGCKVSDIQTERI